MPSLTTNPDGSPHVHQYVRATKPNGRQDPTRFRCNHPDCFHWAYRSDLKGKRTICAICSRGETVMDYENLRRAKPSCIHCGQSGKAKAVRKNKLLLDELFPEESDLLINSGPQEELL